MGQSERASISFVVKESVENVDGLIEDLRNDFADITAAKEIPLVVLAG